MFLLTMSCTKRRASKWPLSGCMLTKAAHLASLSTGVGWAGMGGSLRPSSSSLSAAFMRVECRMPGLKACGHPMAYPLAAFEPSSSSIVRQPCCSVHERHSHPRGAARLPRWPPCGHLTHAAPA